MSCFSKSLLKYNSSFVNLPKLFKRFCCCSFSTMFSSACTLASYRILLRCVVSLRPFGMGNWGHSRVWPILFWLFYNREREIQQNPRPSKLKNFALGSWIKSQKITSQKTQIIEKYQGLVFFVKTQVASVQSFEITRKRQITVDYRVVWERVWFVEIVYMLHIRTLPVFTRKK